MKKKLLSIILISAIVLTMLPVMAISSYAEDANSAVPVVMVKAKTSGTRAVKLSWNKVDSATKYVIYGQKCGKKDTKIKTTTKTSYNVTKIKGKKLLSHKAYKFYVVAYKGSRKLVSSKKIHFFTGKTSGKYANAVSISVNKKTLVLEPGQTATIKAATKIYKNKKHIGKSHGAKTRYLSDHPTVVSVNAKGTVTAKKEGTATIYIQDIGGLWCKTIVTVKKPAQPDPPVSPDPVKYTLNFEKGAGILKYIKENGDEITGDIEVTEGDSFRFKVVTQDGYAIPIVKVDENRLKPCDRGIYTVSNVTANCIISASSEMIPSVHQPLQLNIDGTTYNYLPVFDGLASENGLYFYDSEDAMSPLADTDMAGLKEKIGSLYYTIMPKSYIGYGELYAVRAVSESFNNAVGDKEQYHHSFYEYKGNYMLEGERWCGLYWKPERASDPDVAYIVAEDDRREIVSLQNVYNAYEDALGGTEFWTCTASDASNLSYLWVCYGEHGSNAWNFYYRNEESGILFVRRFTQ